MVLCAPWTDTLPPICRVIGPPARTPFSSEIIDLIEQTSQPARQASQPSQTASPARLQPAASSQESRRGLAAGAKFLDTFGLSPGDAHLCCSCHAMVQEHTPNYIGLPRQELQPLKCRFDELYVYTLHHKHTLRAKNKKFTCVYMSIHKYYMLCLNLTP